MATKKRAPLTPPRVAAFFADRTTGVVIEFTEPHDIAAMKSHPDYFEVTAEDFENYKADYAAAREAEEKYPEADASAPAAPEAPAA